MSERMRRLERFAARNGYLFALEPSVEIREARHFRQSGIREGRAWFGVAGPDGFEVAQHVVRVDAGGGDNAEAIYRWTWAAFTLRMTDNGVALMAGFLEPLLPRGWTCEAVGTELFLVTTRFTRITSPGLWRLLRRVQRALRPALAQPERNTDAAERKRRGTRLAIDKPPTSSCQESRR